MLNQTSSCDKDGKGDHSTLPDWGDPRLARSGSKRKLFSFRKGKFYKNKYLMSRKN